MSKKYLDYDGLLYFWGKLKAYFVPQTRTVNGQALSSDVTIAVPTAGTGSNYPAMDGTRALGSNDGYARVDHVHPTDTSRAASSHTHGNITNAGALQTTDVAIANGDKIVVTDSSNSNKVARTSTAFDGSTTTKALTQKGTFETFVQDASYVHTDSNYTAAEKTKLAGIEAGAEANVQADWNQTTTTADDYIKNKPTIPSYSDFTGATSSAAGAHGLVPAPASGDQDDVLFGDGSWEALGLSNATTTTIVAVNLKKGNTQIGSTNITSATESHAGVMSSEDKTKLNLVSVSSLTQSSITNGYQIQSWNTDGTVGVYADLVATAAIGAASGVCPLNASSKIDSTYLPSYVDDVIEAYPRSGATELSSTWLSTTSGGSALTPEAGKIYVLMADSTSYSANSQFRWGGTTYVKLSDGGVSEITNAEIDTIVAS